MLLTSTTDNLEIILDKAITTNQLSFSVYYNEYTSTTVTPMSNYGTTNSTTAVNLISSPASGNQRQLRWCSINNVDTKDIGVKIRFNDNNSYRNVMYVYLRVGESIQYSEEMGWRVYDNNGSEKIAAFNRLLSSIRLPEWYGTPNLTTTQTLTSGLSYCIYLGRVDRPYSSVKVQYRVTTLANTIGWAEVAIYKGALTLQTNSTLTRVGFTDVSGVVNSTGTKTTTVTTSGLTIGDEIWSVFSVSATTAAVLRAGNPEQIGVGYMQTTAAATRPSTNTTLTPTIDTTTSMPWIAFQHFYQGT
jgi:hypothetical protein